MAESNPKEYTYLKTPVGNLIITGSTAGITSVLFTDNYERTTSGNRHVIECSKQLEDYFSGKRKTFTVSLDVTGTVFQKRIWSELSKIPFGQTISYLELAKRYGDVKSIRATGHANAKNPIAIIVPCHRVIGANGMLTGYAGGLPRKKWLLELEGSLQPELFSSAKAF